MASMPLFLAGFEILNEYMASIFALVILGIGAQYNNSGFSLRCRMKFFKINSAQTFENFNEVKLESFIGIFIVLFATVFLNMFFRDACFSKGGVS